MFLNKKHQKRKNTIKKKLMGHLIEIFIKIAKMKKFQYFQAISILHGYQGQWNLGVTSELITCIS